jgi:hypothetical protein
MIHVLDARGRKKREVEVLFYPSEYGMDKENDFAVISVQGLDSPFLQFTKGGLETLSMDLFFDSYEKGKDVREYTKQISDLLKIDPEIHAPPVLRFIWGNANFTCVLKKVGKKFTMFRSDGVPVRATLSVIFQEYRMNSRSRERPLQSSDKTKIYTVKEGDSLWSISALSYGSPGRWRSIALENGIENPRTIEPGMKIKIPPLE